MGSFCSLHQCVVEQKRLVPQACRNTGMPGQSAYDDLDHPDGKGSSVVKSPATVSPHDLLLWEDGFWCFREEFSEQWLRAQDYRVVVCNSEEWLRRTAQPPH